ncbi:uncharacterized protein [Embiotoca jacksoni]|uniref:uncharacterized protein n=1 Tax=Embiotoca jacksoni TaxID=100190 RepID=UPI003704D0A7
MAPATRKCIFPGCKNRQNNSASLFQFPADEERKRRWIDFVKSHADGEVKINTNSRLCSDHFTTVCFTNFRRRQMDFTDKPLLLQRGAEPSIAPRDLHPPVAPAPSGPAPSAAASSSPLRRAAPSSRDAECQCDLIHKMTRELGLQTDRFVGKKTVATQLSYRTLGSRKNAGSQATVATRTVGVGNTTSKRLPLKRKAGPTDNPPNKRPLMEFLSFQESEIGSQLADLDDSTFLPSISELADTTSTHYLRTRESRPKRQRLQKSSSTETCEGVHREHPFTMSSPNIAEQEPSSVQSSKNEMELQKNDAKCQKPKRQDEQTSTEHSENKENGVEEDEDGEFSTTLIVEDGRHPVDFGSSSEIVVDEECILQLFESCRECGRRCAVGKQVRGLKLVVYQTCGFCQSRRKWTNLPDDDEDKDDGDFQINGNDSVSQHADDQTMTDVTFSNDVEDSNKVSAVKTMSETCSVFGCKVGKGESVSLHVLPKDPRLREKWVQFIWKNRSVPAKLPDKTRVCSSHFPEHYFENFTQKQMGFATKLILKPEAVPCVYPGDTAGTNPHVGQASMAALWSRTRDVGCQCEPRETPKATVATQLSQLTLKHRRSKAIQVKLSPKGISTDVPADFAGFTVKENHLHSKRRRVEDSEDTRHDPYAASKSSHDSTVFSPVTSAQEATEYIVYEDCLLNLFRDCPTCGRTCDVQKCVRSTLLSVSQICSFCDFARQWNSQPGNGGTTAATLHRSAAVNVTGSSFRQFNKELQKKDGNFQRPNRRYEWATTNKSENGVQEVEDEEFIAPLIAGDGRYLVDLESESENYEYPFKYSSNEAERETCAAPPVRPSKTGKEKQKKGAPKRPKTQDEHTKTKRSENGVGEDKEIIAPLIVGDGRFLVDLESSSEFVVDEECILQLFESCRECGRRCAVGKQVRGLKLVVHQTCRFCQSRRKWTNLPDDDDEDKDDGDFQINGNDSVSQHADDQMRTNVTFSNNGEIW